jgi:hypothetical protein
MTIEARIRELGNRHRSLETAIQQEMGHPSADSLHLKALKLRKLRLKEQINALQEARTG